MAMQTSRRARLTALALATGTLVVSATGAGAATVSAPTVFGGKATGTAIHIEINLPVPVTVPVLGSITSLQQDISFTEGNLSKGVAPQPVSVAKAVLGNGNIAVVSNLLAKSAVASLDGQHTASDSLTQDVNLGLIKASVGKISSTVSPESASSTLTTSSSSSLANLSVGLGSLTDDLPIKVDLEEVADTLQGAVGSDGTLSNTIDGALATLDELSEGATAPVSQQITAVKNTLTSLLDQLAQTIGNLSADTDLVRLSLLESTQKVTRSGNAVAADATSVVGGLNILGGLVTVDAAKTTSHSVANGRVGSADAKSSTSLANVKVADVLELNVGEDGLTGSLLGQDLPSEVNSTFQTVLNAVNGALALAGVEIVNGKTTSSVDPNGQYASSSSDGMAIIVNPLHAAKPLVMVQLVPAGTAVNAAVLATTTTKGNPPSVKAPEADTPLAYTGAELPLFALVGSGLAGIALVARRRRRYNEI